MRSPGKRRSRLDAATLTGYFLPASGVLHIDMPSSMYRSIRRDWPLPRPSPNQTLEENIYAATFVHEELHFLQYVGTTCGFLETSLELGRFNLCRELFTQLRLLGVRKIPVPLRDPRAVAFVPSDAREPVERFQRLTSLLHTVDAAIKGDGEKLRTQSELRQEWDALTREWPSLRLSVPLDEIIGPSVAWIDADTDLPAVPVVVGKTKGEVSLVGSTHLCESWATAMELASLMPIVDQAHFEILKDERWFGPYFTVVGILHHNWPAFRDRDFVAQCLYTAAVCELALNPMVPRDTRGTRPLAWADVQPGYRLLSILKCLKRNRTRAIDLSRCDDDYRRFVDDVCDQLGWMSPASSHPDQYTPRSRAGNCGDDWFEKQEAEGFRSIAQERYERPYILAWHPMVGVGNLTWPPLFAFPDVLTFRNGIGYSARIVERQEVGAAVDRYLAASLVELVAEGTYPDALHRGMHVTMHPQVLKELMAAGARPDQVVDSARQRMLFGISLHDLQAYPWEWYSCPECSHQMRYRPSALTELGIEDMERKAAGEPLLGINCPNCAKPLLVDRGNHRTMRPDDLDPDALQHENRGVVIDLTYAEGRARVEALNELADGYLAEAEVERARETLEEALQITDDDPITWYHIGLCRHRLGDPLRAIDAFEFALFLDPSFAQAWNNLSLTYAEVKQYREALRILAQAMEILPASAKLTYNTGAVHLSMGLTARAAEYFRKALALDPAYQRARIALAAVSGREPIG